MIKVFLIFDLGIWCLLIGPCKPGTISVILVPRQPTLLGWLPVSQRFSVEDCVECVCVLQICLCWGSFRKWWLEPVNMEFELSS